jgi:hypothetical protein
VPWLFSNSALAESAQLASEYQTPVLRQLHCRHTRMVENRTLGVKLHVEPVGSSPWYCVASGELQVEEAEDGRQVIDMPSSRVVNRKLR